MAFYAQFRMNFDAMCEELERRRLAAAKDLQAGIKQADVVRKYDVNPSSVSRWNKTIK